MKRTIALIAIALPMSAHADLDPMHELLEVMKEAQGSVGAWLGRNWGADPGNVLLLASSFDPNGMSCHFQSLGGQFYLGAPVSIVGNGFRRQDNPKAFDYSLHLTLGGQNFNAGGEGEFSLQRGDRYDFQDNNGSNGSRREGTVSYGESNGVWLSAAQMNYISGGQVVGTGSAVDDWDPVAGRWNWRTFNDMSAGNWDQRSEGVINHGNWTGAFSTEIVPEPASFAVLGLGLAALARRRARS